MVDNDAVSKPLDEGHAVKSEGNLEELVKDEYVTEAPEQEPDGASDAFEQAARMEALRLSTMALVVALKNLYGEVETRENAEIENWKEREPLLQQRKWACKQQVEILDREISQLQGKINVIQEKIKERRVFVEKVYRQVLVSFYQVHNPEKIADIEMIMSTFRNREHELIKAMFVRYGVDIDTEKLLHAGVVTHSNNENNAKRQSNDVDQSNNDNDANSQDCCFLGDEQTKALSETEEKLWNEVATLEEMRTRAVNQFEEVSRELHFPKALQWTFKHGFEGIYFGMRDFWVEDISLRLFLETFSIRGTPHLAIDIQMGKVSFRLDNFCLKGDKGTKIPSLSPVQLTVTADFTVKVPMEFRLHQNSGKWRIGNNFKVKIIDIKHEMKGSIMGIPTSLLRLVANRFLPGLVKSLLIDAIPPEFGNYLLHLNHFHSDMSAKPPIKFNLNLQVSGSPNNVINVLDRVLWRTNRKKAGWLANSPSLDEAEAVKVKKESIVQPTSASGHSSQRPSSTSVSKSGDDPNADLARIMMGLTVGQARTLHLIQREMNVVNEELMKNSGIPPNKQVKWPGILKTAAEFVRFYFRYSEQSCPETYDTWDSILDAWQQVINKYERSIPDVEYVDIRKMFDGVASLAQKPVIMRLDIDNLCIHTSIDAGANAVCDFLVRSTEELYKQTASKKKVVLTKSLASNLGEIRNSYKVTVHALELLKKFVHKLNFRVDATSQEGDFMVKGSQLQFVGPVSLHIPIVAGYYERPNFSVRTSVTRNELFEVEILIHSDDGTATDKLVKFNLGEISANIFFDVETFLMEKLNGFLSTQSLSGGASAQATEANTDKEKVKINDVAMFKKGMETRQTLDDIGKTKPEGSSENVLLQFIRQCNTGDTLPILDSSFRRTPNDGFNFSIACARMAQLKICSEYFNVSGRLETVGGFVYEYIEKETIKAKEERERVNSSDTSSQVDKDTASANVENLEHLKPIQNLIKVMTKHRKTRSIRLSLVLGLDVKVVENTINRKKELVIDLSCVDKGDNVRSISFENEFSLLDLISDLTVLLSLFQGG